LGGPTDSYRDGLDPFTGGLGLVPYSNGVRWRVDAAPGGGYTEEPIQPRLI
jgi:hypothetical protein